MNTGNIQKISNEIKKAIELMFRIKKKDLLIIPVDDVDLKAERAYEFMHELMNYLSLPDVVIVMSADYTQLEMVMEQYYFKFHKCDDDYAMSEDRREFIKHGAADFLIKLFPEHHRIHLQEIAETKFTIKYVQANSDEKNTDIVSKRNHKSNAEERIVDSFPIKDRKGDPIPFDRQLLIFLERKTGIALTTSPNQMCRLIPNNLRGITDLLAMLNSMPTIFGNYRDSINGSDPDKDLREKWRDNLSRFERYLCATWAEKNLDEDCRNKLNDIADASNEMLFQTIILSVSNYKEENDPEYIPYNYPDKQNYNDYSLGDVMDMLFLFERIYRHIGENVYNLIFGIELVLTIRMYSILIDQVEQKFENQSSIHGDYPVEWRDRSPLEDFMHGELLGTLNLRDFFSTV